LKTSENYFRVITRKSANECKAPLSNNRCTLNFCICKCIQLLVHMPYVSTTSILTFQSCSDTAHSFRGKAHERGSGQVSVRPSVLQQQVLAVWPADPRDPPGPIPHEAESVYVEFTTVGTECPHSTACDDMHIVSVVGYAICYGSFGTSQ